MATLDPEMAAKLVEPIEALGVEVRLRTPVSGFEPGKVLLEDGTSVGADLVVLGLGVQPNTELASDAGAELGSHGASPAIQPRFATIHKP